MDAPVLHGAHPTRAAPRREGGADARTGGAVLGGVRACGGGVVSALAVADRALLAVPARFSPVGGRHEANTAALRVRGRGEPRATAPFAARGGAQAAACEDGEGDDGYGAHARRI